MKRSGGLRLVLLVTVVRIQTAEAQANTQQDVILIVAVVSFIFLTSLAYFTVTCAYYHCVYKSQLSGCGAGKDKSAEDDLTHPNISVSASSSSQHGVEPSGQDGLDVLQKTVIGERTLPVDTSQVDPVAPSHLPHEGSCDECCHHERGLGPSDLDLPEVLQQPVGAELASCADTGESRGDSGAENAPPMPQIRPRPPPGYSKSLSNPQLETMLNEAQDPMSGCCTVWDMCSPGWSLAEGLPPASAVAGPPSAPRAPTSMPKGRLRL